MDFPITDVLQMMGRAGRPQYDQHGVAVIMVADTKKSFYKKACSVYLNAPLADYACKGRSYALTIGRSIWPCSGCVAAPTGFEAARKCRRHVLCMSKNTHGMLQLTRCQHLRAVLVRALPGGVQPGRSGAHWPSHHLCCNAEVVGPERDDLPQRQCIPARQ